MYPALKDDVDDGGILENFELLELEKNRLKSNSAFNQAHTRFIPSEDNRVEPESVLSGVKSESQFFAWDNIFDAK